ncbi:hypothetical protein LCGC14_2560010 [marine sediment metagenome]|uniref:Uncharacterized protein n=1 Tax=marine sediment metagenome TaxID=412755 RepID=A0A0F9AKU8_9ZZZZ
MGLKIYQLIDELKKYDQDLDVVVDGYEGGTNPISIENIGLRYVDTSEKLAYFGEYGDAYDNSEGMKSPLLVAIIGRNRYG